MTHTHTPHQKKSKGFSAVMWRLIIRWVIIKTNFQSQKKEKYKWLYSHNYLIQNH